MARVFITGSSDGLGLMAAKLLIEQGHEVVLHGRNEGRSRDALTSGQDGVPTLSRKPINRVEEVR
jgi:NAD(P)-dependent dehydrogenase (short-subunit alcohol dehydrogenase family)